MFIYLWTFFNFSVYSCIRSWCMEHLLITYVYIFSSSKLPMNKLNVENVFENVARVSKTKHSEVM